MAQFTFPTPNSQQRVLNLLKWNGKDSAQQIVRQTADGLIPRPAVKDLGSTVPEADPAVEIAYHDGIVRQFQQARLPFQRGDNLLPVSPIAFRGFALRDMLCLPRGTNQFGRTGEQFT